MNDSSTHNTVISILVSQYVLRVFCLRGQIAGRMTRFLLHFNSIYDKIFNAVGINSKVNT